MGWLDGLDVGWGLGFLGDLLFFLLQLMFGLFEFLELESAVLELLRLAIEPGLDFGLVVLLLLELFLELNDHTLLLQPPLLVLPRLTDLLTPLLLEHPRQILNLVLLDQYFLLQLTQLVLVELHLLEVLHLLLEFVQLVLDRLLLAEAGVPQGRRLPQRRDLALQLVDFLLLQPDGLLVGVAVFAEPPHQVVDLRLAVLQLAVGFLQHQLHLVQDVQILEVLSSKLSKI